MKQQELQREYFALRPLFFHTSKYFLLLWVWQWSRGTTTSHKAPVPLQDVRSACSSSSPLTLPQQLPPLPGCPEQPWVTAGWGQADHSCLGQLRAAPCSVGLCCCPQSQPGSAALFVSPWSSGSSGSSSSTSAAFSEPSPTGARLLAGELSRDGCSSCPPSVWHGWAGSPLSSASLAMISEGTEQGGSPNGGHPLAHPVRAGMALPPLWEPTWAQQPLLQEGGSRDPGKGRTITGCKSQHSSSSTLGELVGRWGMRVGKNYFIPVPGFAQACYCLQWFMYHLHAWLSGLCSSRVPNFSECQPACVLGCKCLSLIWGQRVSPATPANGQIWLADLGNCWALSLASWMCAGLFCQTSGLWSCHENKGQGNITFLKRLLHFLLQQLFLKWATVNTFAKVTSFC